VGDLEGQTPGLFRWDRPSLGNLRTLHRNLLTVGFPNNPNPYSITTFDQFMNNLDNFEPFDDLEDWSDSVDLFMDTMAQPSLNADTLWELAKCKKGKSKASEEPSKSIFDKPWIKEPEGLTPTQSWLHWMNENALRVEMGIPLLAHPKHTYSKIGGLTDSDSEYSSNPEHELDDLVQYSKEVESNSTKNPKSDQDSLPDLVIYATP
jgi:hypothetical protein